MCAQLDLVISRDFRHEFYTSKASGKDFDINKRLVYTLRALDQGHAGLEKFTALMNMPKPMTANNYDKLVSNISTVAKVVADETMEDAVNDIREVAKADENTIVNTGIACDGSWQQRGYASLNGVVTTISLENGKVIDVEPMGKNCKACCLKEQLKQTDPEAYANWRNSHICNFNYKGSSSGIESVGAKRIFLRSMSKHKVRYLSFLGDGDSKSFSTVKDIYPDFTVVKRECIGHYQKRIGNRTRKLKKRVKGLGGRGRLTNATIDRLQNYFGIAIRQNSESLKEMQAATRVTLFHVASNAKNNWHYPHFPTGINSWCRYNRDKANNTKTYKPGPGLPLDIVAKLKIIFEELTTEENLQKCLHGETQNRNESFNGTIWERIPKSKYVSLKQFEFGVYDDVANFNIGRKASILIFEKLGMIPGKYTLKGCFTLNKK